MPGGVLTRGGVRARGGGVRTRGGFSPRTRGGRVAKPADGVGVGGEERKVRARGRGVRTRRGKRRRGASASARAGPSRIHVEVPLEVVQIQEYPECQPMEVPLRPLKKRPLRRQSPIPTATAIEVDLPSTNVGKSDGAGTSGVSEVRGIPGVRTRGERNPRTRGGRGRVVTPGGRAPMPADGVGGKVRARGRGVRTRGGKRRRGASASTRAGPSRIYIGVKKPSPVPAALAVDVDLPSVHVEVPACSTPTTSRNSGRQLQDDETENINNCGSDLDSDDDEDEVVTVPLGIPRTAYLYMETPTDPPVPSQEPTSSIEGAAAWMSDPMYDFQWLPFPNPPVPQKIRRETFTVNNIGPTVSDTTPVNIFKCIWDADIMGTIVTETNRYANQLAAEMLKNNSLCPSSRICYWKDTTVEELYIFFGIILAMGVVIKSRLTEYWSTSDDIFSTPGFSVNMSLKRFQLLSTCLHFRDNSQLPQNINAPEARLFKIDPVIKHLNLKFQTMYVMGQNISLDESLLQWRGWLQISQLIPNKAAIVGIKTYELCESQTGYLWRFILHSHGPGRSQAPQQDPLSAFTPSLVLELLKGLQHKGYTVWMDNFYNSPILARKLKRLGFDCVGTLRTNRQFVPVAIGALEKCHMKPGQITGVTSGDVDLMVWRDHNRVATISTYHGNTVITDSDGNTKPTLIRDYNIMMGGVDKKDQLLSSYPIERKRSKVWYKKLFRRLLNVSVLNSYVIHKKLTHNSMDHREFRHELIKNLLQKGQSDKPSVAEIFDLRFHYLAVNPFGAESSKGRLRRGCKVCHKSTILHCVGCNKSACLGCYRQLHL